MITTIKEYNDELAMVHCDFIDKIENRIIIRKPTNSCFQLDKPVHILVNNKKQYTVALEDKGDYYEHEFTCFGFNPKSYLNDFAWVIDKDTVFYIERPFRNRVVRLLKRLLPTHKIKTLRNDIIIDNVKIGPTQEGGPTVDPYGINSPEHSSMIYCLRWSNPEGLDKYFHDDPNHQKRIQSEVPIGALDQFLSITQEQFIKLLEEMK